MARQLIGCLTEWNLIRWKYKAEVSNYSFGEYVSLRTVGLSAFLFYILKAYF